MPRPHEYSYVTRDEYQNPKGVNDAWWINHVSFGKESIYSTDSPSPYLLPNEWICGNIAQFLRIPVPPFAMMRNGKDEPVLFTSLQFTPDMTPPPDAKPAKCWKADRDLCTGVVLFDVLIANNDRHKGNIAVDDPANPKAFFIHDHDKALLGGMFGDCKIHLDRNIAKFAVNWHCLIEWMDTDEFIPDWIGRIQSIPPWFIDEICKEASSHGFRKPEIRSASRFLKWRAKHFDTLVTDNKDRFTAIKQWRRII